MAKFTAHEKALLDLVLADGEIDEQEAKRLALLVYTGGKSHAELMAEVERREDVRAPIEIAALLVTPDRIRNDAERHAAIIAQQTTRNRIVLQSIAGLVLGIGVPLMTGGAGSFGLSSVKPVLAGLIKLLGIGDDEMSPVSAI